jgi:hypothetical protein
LDFGGLRFRDDTLLVVAAGSELRQVDVQTGETVSRLRVWAKQVRLTAGGLIREGDAFLLPSANWKSVNEALPVPADVAQFSPSGRWLAWSRGPFLRVAAPDALKTPRLDAVHPERISDIVLSESFVAVMGRNLIAWWNLETGVKRTLASRPHALALDSSLGSLFMGNKDGLLLQIRLSDGEELQRYTRKTPSARAHFVGHAAHTSKIAALRVVNEGRHIVSAAFSRTHYCNAAIWSRDGEELWRSEDVLGGYDYVDVSPDFRRLALGSRASNKVRILSLKKILAR